MANARTTIAAALAAGMVMSGAAAWRTAAARHGAAPHRVAASALGRPQLRPRQAA